MHHHVHRLINKNILYNVLKTVIIILRNQNNGKTIYKRDIGW